MKPLNEVELSIEDDCGVDDHAEITIEASTWRADDPDTAAEYADVSPERINAANRRVAGVIGMLALELAPWIGIQGQKHGCRCQWHEPPEADPEHPYWLANRGIPEQFDCCSLSWGGLPGGIYKHPVIHLLVPVDAVKPWLARISTAVAAIEAAWP